MAKDIIQIEEDKWYPLTNNETIICCDCCLVHKIKLGKKNGKLYAKWKRDDKLTGLYRRGKEAKLTIKNIAKKLST